MRTHYRIHRWLAIPLGVFLFVQALTGALYVLPMPRVPLSEVASPVAWDDVGVTPQAAAGDAVAERVLLYSVGDVPVYEVAPHGAPSFFVDARDGSRFEMGETEARDIAGAALDTEAAIREVRRVDEYEFFYPGGHLPAFDVVFDDGNEIYVEAPSGRVAHGWNTPEKARNILVRIHDFDIVHRIVSSTRLTHLLLLALSALSGLAVLTGYNILWQQRRTRLRTERLRAERGAPASAPVPPPRD